MFWRVCRVEQESTVCFSESSITETLPCLLFTASETAIATTKVESNGYKKDRLAHKA